MIFKKFNEVWYIHNIRIWLNSNITWKSAKSAQIMVFDEICQLLVMLILTLISEMVDDKMWW